MTTARSGGLAQAVGLFDPAGTGEPRDHGSQRSGHVDNLSAEQAQVLKARAAFI